MSLAALLGMLDAWAANLWLACWQGSLFVLGVWVVCRLVPSMPGRWRCWFLRLAMLKFMAVLLLPCLIRVPLLPAPALVSSPVVCVSSANAVPASVPAGASVTPAPVIVWPSLREVLCFAWLLGVGFSCIYLLMAWFLARKMRSGGCVVTSGPMIEQLRYQAGLFGLGTAGNTAGQSCRGTRRRTPRVIEVPGGGSPMLVGLFRPTLLIPTDTWARLSVAERTMVLGHELAHVRRGDLFWCLVVSLVRAVFFFHPLVWWGERQVRLAQEIAADELAIARQGHDPIGYGSLLVSIVGKLGSKAGVRSLVSMVSLETVGPVHSLTRRLVAMARIGRTASDSACCEWIECSACAGLRGEDCDYEEGEGSAGQMRGSADDPVAIRCRCMHYGTRFGADIDGDGAFLCWRSTGQVYHSGQDGSGSDR